METNNKKAIIYNGTTTDTSSTDQNMSMIFAGHVLLVFYCAIFILGFLGNFTVIYVAIKKKKYRNVTNCYVINLALADLLFLTLAIPYTTYLGLVDNYPFGETFCRVYMYLAYVFLLATCNTLAAMSIDRCFYIVLPSSKLKYRTPQTALLVCIFIWASSLALIIPYHIVLHKFTSGLICGVNDRTSFIVCFLIFCSYYALPLFIITVFYTKLAMHVIQSNRLILNQMNNRSVPKSLKTKQRQVTRMVIVVTLAFAVCWLPIHILELMKCANSSILNTISRSHPKLLYCIRVLTHALAYFNSCLNPYLYALLNRNFCCDLMDVIPSYFMRQSQAPSAHTKSSHFRDKCLLPTVIPNESFLKLKSTVKDETNCDEEDKPQRIDVGCQIELLAANRK